jgi:hypothetical protein
MKLPFVIIIAATLGAPIVSFAQAPQTPMTRAQVRTDLRRVERAGYSPARRDDASYPADIQAAEARIAWPDGSPDETRSMRHRELDIAVRPRHGKPWTKYALQSPLKCTFQSNG